MAKGQKNNSLIDVKQLAAEQDYWEKFDACVVIVGPWADCKFYSAWFAAVADLQKLWVEAWKDKQFSSEVDTLIGRPFPHFGEAASIQMMSLKRNLTSAILDLGMDDLVEFFIMCKLGLFKRIDKVYEMSLPELISLDRVKRAAFSAGKTKRLLDRHPERVFVSMQRQQAVTLQKQLFIQINPGL